MTTRTKAGLKWHKEAIMGEERYVADYLGAGLHVWSKRTQSRRYSFKLRTYWLASIGNNRPHSGPFTSMAKACEWIVAEMNRRDAKRWSTPCAWSNWK